MPHQIARNYFIKILILNFIYLGKTIGVQKFKMINWCMSTTAMENVTVNVTYISYYSDEDEETVDINVNELIEQFNTTITDYAVI